MSHRGFSLDIVLAVYNNVRCGNTFMTRRIFGASNITKLLNEISIHQREDAVNSLAYEAEARINDPVYGCIGVISILQNQVRSLREELDVANANLIRLACNGISTSGYALSTSSSVEFNRRIVSIEEEGSTSHFIDGRSSCGSELPSLPPPWPEIVKFSGNMNGENF
ncbi:protein IAL1-like [Papaver somniferum]|uniref:protein IAL1-like n=1 Tax=Papaver somniferum TaxID=3469 RepID=UPI000E700BB5|nr:protein IAL1-like [Papaver somniferum]